MGSTKPPMLFFFQVKWCSATKKYASKWVFLDQWSTAPLGVRGPPWGPRGVRWEGGGSRTKPFSCQLHKKKKINHRFRKTMEKWSVFFVGFYQLGPCVCRSHLIHLPSHCWQRSQEVQIMEMRPERDSTATWEGPNRYCWLTVEVWSLSIDRINTFKFVLEST